MRSGVTEVLRDCDALGEFLQQRIGRARAREARRAAGVTGADETDAREARLFLRLHHRLAFGLVGGPEAVGFETLRRNGSDSVGAVELRLAEHDLDVDRDRVGWRAQPAWLLPIDGGQAQRRNDAGLKQVTAAQRARHGAVLHRPLLPLGGGAR